MLIRRAELDGETVDVHVASGRIRAVGAGLPDASSGEAVLDARGGALLPGLHDHHLHLFAWARALESAACGPPTVRDAPSLARALACAPRHQGWIRGTGYHESVAGPLHRGVLDAVAPDCPVRVQHRSGSAWFLNSRAVDALGLDAGIDAEGVARDERGRATGALHALDGWLRKRLPPGPPPDLAPLGRRLARQGTVGVTDATPGNDAEALSTLAAARARGALPQDVLLMGAPDLPEPREPGLARGPEKILLRETALPHLDALTRRIARAHSGDRAVAIHCVTRTELVFAATALREAGPLAGDRIEHASVAPPDAVALLAELGVTVVTQPNFLRERGDAYRADVAPRDRPWLYRCAGLLSAGIPLGAGTDAPFGDPDPWRAMRAAVDRRSERGVALEVAEALPPERALALFTTPARAPGAAPRRIAPGEPADLCLLDRPWKQARDRLDAGDVVATLQRGAILARNPGPTDERVHP